MIPPVTPPSAGAPSGRPDVESRGDCERLVRAFYGRAMTDPIIGYIFVDVAKLDLVEHIPVITSFWETMLLGHRTYAGGAFGVHQQLHARAPLRAEHFTRWLSLWTTTVDELFAGPRAELAKAHADRVARAFLRRLTDPAAEPVPGPGTPVGLPVTWHAAGR